MAEDFKRLAKVRLQSTPTLIYEAPAAPTEVQAIIKAIFVNNVSGAQTSVTMWQGGSGDSDVLLNPTTLEAGEYGTWDGGALTVDAADSLYGQCSQDDGVTVIVEGLEVSV